MLIEMVIILDSTNMVIGDYSGGDGGPNSWRTMLHHGRRNDPPMPPLWMMCAKLHRIPNDILHDRLLLLLLLLLLHH